MAHIELTLILTCSFYPISEPQSMAPVEDTARFAIYRVLRLRTPYLLAPVTLGLRIDTWLICPTETVRSSRGLDLLRVCPLCRPSNRRSVLLPPPSGLGAESGDETRGVERYGRFASCVEGFRGWRAHSAGLAGGGPAATLVAQQRHRRNVARSLRGGCRSTVLPRLGRTVTSDNVPERPVGSLSKRGTK